MLALYVVSVILGVAGIGMYIGFFVTEGKDERGRAILASAAQVAFIFIFLGYAFHLMFMEFAKPDLEQLRASVTLWMALVFAGQAAGILVYRRKM